MTVIKACIFDFPKKEMDLPGYHIESFDPMEYLERLSRFALRDLFAGGLDRFSKRRALVRAEGVDRLYRDRDPSYMRMIRDFLDRFGSYDLVVMFKFNFIHPEILFFELKNSIKIFGFIDDPYSTYVRGIPYLWAFDGAFYISPAYDDRSLFSQALERWGCLNTFWWPLTQQFFPLPEKGEEFFRNRHKDIVYVGSPTLSKVDRLIELKKKFGRRLHVHGRWRAAGYFGLLRGLVGERIYWSRVTTLTPEERSSLYYDTKIGFNMHISERPTETGNTRMYELPAHGLLQICDKAARNAHEIIFIPNKEAVFYDDIHDAIDKIEYYLAHESERMEIAHAGYERVRRDYDWQSNLLKFLDWAVNLPKNATQSGARP